MSSHITTTAASILGAWLGSSDSSASCPNVLDTCTSRTSSLCTPSSPLSAPLPLILVLHPLRRDKTRQEETEDWRQCCRLLAYPVCQSKGQSSLPIRAGVLPRGVLCRAVSPCVPLFSFFHLHVSAVSAVSFVFFCFLLFSFVFLFAYVGGSRFFP